MMYSINFITGNCGSGISFFVNLAILMMVIIGQCHQSKSLMLVDPHNQENKNCYYILLFLIKIADYVQLYNPASPALPDQQYICPVLLFYVLFSMFAIPSEIQVYLLADNIILCISRMGYTPSATYSLIQMQIKSINSHYHHL